jgi:hypothetical protein
MLRSIRVIIAIRGKTLDRLRSLPIRSLKNCVCTALRNKQTLGPNSFLRFKYPIQLHYAESAREGD